MNLYAEVLYMTYEMSKRAMGKFCLLSKCIIFVEGRSNWYEENMKISCLTERKYLSQWRDVAARGTGSLTDWCRPQPEQSCLYLTQI